MDDFVACDQNSFYKRLELIRHRLDIDWTSIRQDLEAVAGIVTELSIGLENLKKPFQSITRSRPFPGREAGGGVVMVVVLVMLVVVLSRR